MPVASAAARPPYSGAPRWSRGRGAGYEPERLRQHQSNGVTATPVIDLNRNAIYVIAMTMNAQTVTTQYDRLHALDLGTGTELSVARR